VGDSLLVVLLLKAADVEVHADRKAAGQLPVGQEHVPQSIAQLAVCDPTVWGYVAEFEGPFVAKVGMPLGVLCGRSRTRGVSSGQPDGETNNEGEESHGTGDANDFGHACDLKTIAAIELVI